MSRDGSGIVDDFDPIWEEFYQRHPIALKVLLASSIMIIIGIVLATIEMLT